MFKRTVGDVGVKKIVYRFEEQQENIMPLQENGKPIQEPNGKQEENNEQEEDEALCSLYKRFNMKIHHHSWFTGLLGLIGIHKGIHPQTIFC